jgi:hypothetical protein
LTEESQLQGRTPTDLEISRRGAWGWDIRGAAQTTGCGVRPWCCVASFCRRSRGRVGNQRLAAEPDRFWPAKLVLDPTSQQRWATVTTPSEHSSWD